MVEEDEELMGDGGLPDPDSIDEDYQSMVIDEPEREVDLSGYEGAKTISEAEEETEHKTDLQSILKALTPRFPDKLLNDKLQPVMVSRIFPDNLLDSCKMTVLSRLQDYEPSDNSFDVWGIILAVHNAHSIGFEGRGIMDRLEIAGVAHEEEMEKLTKELGI